MRHNVAHRKLGRVTEHRLALLRNQAIALLRHEKIETTMPKAKELRPFVERLITIARRGVAAASPTARRCTRAGWSSRNFPTRKWSASCSRRSRRDSRSGPAATRGFFGSVSAAGIRPRSRTSSWSAASTTRAAKTDKEEGEEAPKKAKGVGERLKRAAQRIRGARARAAPRRRPAGRPRVRRGSPRRRAKPAALSLPIPSSKSKGQSWQVSCKPGLFRTYVSDLDLGT